MALTERQIEFFDDLKTAYHQEDFIKPLSNFAERFLSNNLERYEEEGGDIYVSVKQWKWLWILGEEFCDLDPKNYSSDLEQ